MFGMRHLDPRKIKRKLKCCSPKLAFCSLLLFFLVYFITTTENYRHDLYYLKQHFLSSRRSNSDFFQRQAVEGYPNSGKQLNKKLLYEQYVNAETLESLDKRYLLFLIRRTFTDMKNSDIPDYKFNETLSHSIPLDRETPDYRDKACHGYPWVIAPDKRVSIIISLINETWSVLLRTVFSILTKSPLQYIQEIILVDDHSSRDYLINPLREVLHPFKQISLVRTPRTLGPAGARNYGASFAKGNTLVFLDAHIEMNIGWLEPLLDAITKYTEKIFVPIIGNIESKSLKIYSVNKNAQNTLAWTLGASHGSFQQSVLEKYKVTDPIPSAGMLGAAHIVDKSYYWKLGGMGEYFEGWGSEDVEMGIKSWLCGGGVSKCRCSIVSHLFKDHPYKMTNNPSMNVAMMAEAWLDEFVPVIKCIRIGYFHLPNVVNKAPLESTLALKKKLKCKPFRWFINHVYPELGIPEKGTLFIGASVSDGYRISLGRDNMTMIFLQKYSPSVSIGPVSIVGDMVKLHGKCMTYTETNTLIFDTCRGGDRFQRWQYFNFRIRSKFDTRLCLARQNYTPILQTCSKSKLQIKFETRFKPGCIQNNE